MGDKYRAFIVVMVVSFGVLLIAKPVFVRWMSADDFVSRRNAWFALTAAGFLLPSLWLYMLVAGVIIWFAARRDTNPAALYLFLLLVMPPLEADLPTFGIVKSLFPINHIRLLSLVLLIPLALRLRREGSELGVQASSPPSAAIRAIDVLLLLFLVLQLMLFVPYESITNSLRRAFLMLLTTWLPYYVMGRACRDRRMVVEAMAALVLAAMVLAPIAAIENVKGWLLYSGVGDSWGTDINLYSRRADVLRASATAGHPIVLGFFFAVTLGLWLYLQRHVARGWAWLGVAVLGTGLVAAFARGPWVGALAIITVYVALGPNALSRSLKGIALLIVAGGIALATPIGPKVLNNLPFIGNVANDTIEYRQQLLEISLTIIGQNPFFGSPNFLLQMEDLRQGEGIIDLVNTFAAFALSYGLVGLALFMGFIGVAMVQCWRSVRRFSLVDPDAAMIGVSLIACLLGVLVMLATTSNYLSIPYVYLALAGLMRAYVRDTALPVLQDLEVKEDGSQGRFQRFSNSPS